MLSFPANLIFSPFRFVSNLGMGYSRRTALDLDPEPALSVSDLKDANKNICFLSFFACPFLKVHFHHSSKKNVIKKSEKVRYWGFSYYSCLVMEGSGSGSVPLTSGSGSGGPKTALCITKLYFYFQLTTVYNAQLRKSITSGLEQKKHWPCRILSHFIFQPCSCYPA